MAFAKGALPELIRHNSDGLLAEPFSESSLAANMKLLLDHPSKATAMGRAGMFRLQNEFTQQNWLKKIQGVYEIVLDRGLSLRDRGLKIDSLKRFFSKFLILVIMAASIYGIDRAVAAYMASRRWLRCWPFFVSEA